MEFTKFGRTGLTISRMCLGTGTFGKQTDAGDAYRILDKAAEAGVNYIDTADLYPPSGTLGSGSSASSTGEVTSKRSSPRIMRR
jgi:1-deoxyxylulose-5-phosphate synthase